jgi:imidazolonepropionase-like amidohydrolase
LKGATLFPIDGPPIENGTLLVEGGKIRALGANVRVPSGAEIRDLRGRVILPGLVDTHSHIGQVAGADASGPIQPEVRALDSINMPPLRPQQGARGRHHHGQRHAGLGPPAERPDGVSEAAPRQRRRGLAIRDADGRIAGGIKMANGTNPMRASPFPGTRGKSAALMRAQLVAAQEYCAKQADRKLPADKKPARDLGAEALCEALSGRRLVHHHTHRHDDVLTVLRLADEFGLRVVLHHVSEAGLVARRSPPPECRPRSSTSTAPAESSRP